MGFQDELVALSDRAVLVAEQARADELMPYEEKREVLAALVELSKSQAHALGVAAMKLTEAVLVANQIFPYVVDYVRAFEQYSGIADVRRLQAAVTTALEDNDRAAMRLERLTRAEVVQSGQQGLQTAMIESPYVVGWQRELEKDACELCQWWAREGRVWPVDHVMPTHKGCACTPSPVYSDEYRGIVEPTGEARKAWKKENERNGAQ